MSHSGAGEVSRDAPATPPVLFVGVNGRDNPPLSRVLSRLGFRTLIAYDQDAVRRHCELGPAVDVCVLDLEARGFDWAAMAAQLRARSNCRILAIAPNDMPTRVLGELRGLGDFVLRPVNNHEFLSRVHHLLGAGRNGDAVGGRATGEGGLWLQTRNPAMRQVLGRIDRVAPTEATVLLRGETGTGKEVLARHLHALSRRSSGPFLSINCGSLADSLLDSELFGHERGSFTGAVRRKRGLVELADGGTLFLDEIGELSPTMQVKLLRVLQEREFMRVGGEEVLTSDVRVVAATHRNLEEMIREGAFREDLYYRLQVVPVFIPALRQRLIDIPDLAQFLLDRLAVNHGRECPALTDAAVERLLRHRWPGNIRELENVLERALLLGMRDVVDAFDLDPDLPGLAGPEAAEGRGAMVAAKRQQARDYLVRLLTRHQGNIKAAAQEAGVDRRTIYRQLRTHEIDPNGFRNSAA